MLVARKARELALRAQLSPSQDAMVGKTGVHLLRGRHTWHLTDRELDALVRVWQLVRGGLLRDADAVLEAHENGDALRSDLSASGPPGAS